MSMYVQRAAGKPWFVSKIAGIFEYLGKVLKGSETLAENVYGE